MTDNEKRRPSKKLTTYVTEAYNVYQQKLKSGREGRELDKEKKVLDQKIIELIDKGYTVLQGSSFGVMITEESETPPYKTLYNTLVQRMLKMFPDDSEYISRTARRLVRESIRSIKHNVTYDTNENLEKRINSIEDPKEAKKRNGIKRVDLVLYA